MTLDTLNVDNPIFKSNDDEIEQAAQEKKTKKRKSKKLDLENSIKKPKIDEELPEEKNEMKMDQETDELNFTVLGHSNFEKTKKVKMILPPWLAHPALISKSLTDGQTIKDVLYLNKRLKANLTTSGVKSFFPVQSELIPWILKAHTRPPPFWPRDLCVSAPTGSGKTLAFVVPIVQILQKRVERKIRALVVLPVQELANQVAKVFVNMCAKTNVICCLLSTSSKFSDEQTLLVEKINGEYQSKVDIVVTTAGRLVEHLNSTKGFSLKYLKFLVIDEADRVMQEIQNNWLYHINKHVQEDSAVLSGKSIPLNLYELFREAGHHTQKLLFSATLSSDPEKLKALNLFQPKLFTTAIDWSPNTVNNTMEDNIDDIVGSYTVPSELTQRYCLAQIKYRPLVLFSLIKSNNWTKFLCFTNSKKDAHRLAFLLQQLFTDDMIIEELSSALNPKQRKVIIEKFTKGAFNGLVCSDALARGIDIPEVDVVISYEPTDRLPTYIHRIGRTARAGRPGTAVTITTDSENVKFLDLIKSIQDSKITEIFYPLSMIEEIQEDYKKALHNLELAARVEKQESYLATQKKKKQRMDRSSKLNPNSVKSLSVFEKLQANLPSTEDLLVKSNLEDVIAVSAAWKNMGGNVNGGKKMSNVNRSKKNKSNKN